MNEVVMRDVTAKVTEDFEALGGLRAHDLGEVKRRSKQAVAVGAQAGPTSASGCCGARTSAHSIRQADGFVMVLQLVPALGR